MSDNAFLAFVALFFLALFAFIFWMGWRAYTRRGFVYFCGIFFFIGVMGYSMLNSAIPSSAPRKQVEGRLVDILKHGNGKGATYTFTILLNSGAMMGFREGVSPPRESYHQLLLVTYLDEKVPNEYPRAIAAKNLTGPYAGSSNSVNPDWLGPWILFPIGIVGFGWSNFKARSNQRNPPKPAAKSEITELKL